MRVTTLYLIAVLLLASCTGGDVVVPIAPTTGTIQGVVRGSSGTARLAGVQVSTIPGSGSQFTDTSGAFRIEGVAPRDYFIKAYHVDASHVQSAMLPINVVGGSVTSVDLILRDSSSQRGYIYGTVVDEQGRPAFGALVTTQPSTTTASADSSGTFMLHDVSSGTYTVRAMKGDLIAMEQVDVNTYTPSSVILRLAPRDAQRGYLTGRVTSKGAPLVGVKVGIEILNIYDTTDANGEYTLRYIWPDEYDLRCSGDGYVTRRERVIVQGGVTSTYNIELEPGFDISQDGLELYVPLNQNYLDYSPRKRAMKYYAGRFVPDRHGNPTGALECYGGGGVATASGEGMNLLPLTMGAWLYVPRGYIGTNEQFVCGTIDPVMGDGYSIMLSDYGVQFLYYTEKASRGFNLVTANYSRDTWFWVGMSVGADGTGYVSLNGQPSQPITSSSLTAPAKTSAPFGIGSVMNRVRYTLNGRIDHVVVYSRKVPFNELVQIMENGD